MLFDKPTEGEIEYALQGIMRPFPAGLMTPVGLVVASPSNAPEQKKGDRDALRIVTSQKCAIFRRHQ